MPQAGSEIATIVHDPVNALASIPSPSSGSLDVGPLTFRAYGVMLLLGILAAVALTVRRWTGKWRWSANPEADLVFRVAIWGVAGGIVGARLYHVATSWNEVPDEWWGPFAIWRGGLGVWGGIAGGVLAGSLVLRRAGQPLFPFYDATAPGLLLAQTIGRLGNYFNQELFGKPTDLPWGLEIDPENRPAVYPGAETFHPTFLYELLWNGIGVAVLLLVSRFVRIRPPGLFALYVAWYTFGRFFIELLRIDPAHELGPLRLNGYVALILFVAAVTAFVWSQRRGGRSRGAPPPRPRRTMAVPKGRVRPGR